MSDLTASVTQFWNFFWPAALSLVATLAIVRYCAPSVPSQLWRALAMLPLRRTVRFLHSKTAEALGVPKIIPFVTLFLVLLLLVIHRDLVHFVGRELPPTILWTSPHGFIANASDSDLLLIWRQLPENTDLGQLARYIESKWAELAQDSGYRHFQERHARLSALAESLKFYFALLCILVALALSGRIQVKRRRVLLLSLFFCACFSLNMAYLIHTQKKLLESKVSVVRDFAALKPVSASAELDERRAQDIQRRREFDMSWWGFGMPSWSW